MTLVAEGVVRLTGQDQGVARMLANTQRQMRSMQGEAQRTGGSLKRIFEFAAGAAVFSGISKMTNSISDMGKMAIHTAGRAHEMNLVLGLLGKQAGISSASIDHQVNSMKKLGVTTAVAQATLSQFIRYNLDSAKASQLARVAQDAAIFSGENSSETLKRLSYGIQQYDVQMLRTAGININTASSFQTMATSLGKSSEELTETERQQAVLNSVIKEGSRIAGAYTTAMQSPEKQLRSFARYTEELAESVGHGMIPAFGGAVTLATALVKGFTKLTGEGTAFREVVTRISTEVGEKFNDMARRVENAFGKIQAATKGLNVGEWIDKIKTSVAGLLPVFGGLIGLFTAGKKGMLGFLGPWGSVIAVIGGLVSSTNEGREAMKGLFGEVARAVAAVLPPLVKAFSEIAEAVAEALPPVVKLATEIIKALTPVLTLAAHLTAQLAPAISTIVTFLGQLAGMLAQNTGLIKVLIGLALVRWVMQATQGFREMVQVGKAAVRLMREGVTTGGRAAAETMQQLRNGTIDASQAIEQMNGKLVEIRGGAGVASEGMATLANTTQARAGLMNRAVASMGNTFETFKQKVVQGAQLISSTQLRLPGQEGGGWAQRVGDASKRQAAAAAQMSRPVWASGKYTDQAVAGFVKLKDKVVLATESTRLLGRSMATDVAMGTRMAGQSVADLGRRFVALATTTKTVEGHWAFPQTVTRLNKVSKAFVGVGAAMRSASAVAMNLGAGMLGAVGGPIGVGLIALTVGFQMLADRIAKAKANASAWGSATAASIQGADGMVGKLKATTDAVKQNQAEIKRLNADIARENKKLASSKGLGTSLNPFERLGAAITRKGKATEIGERTREEERLQEELNKSFKAGQGRIANIQKILASGSTPVTASLKEISDMAKTLGVDLYALGEDGLKGATKVRTAFQKAGGGIFQAGIDAGLTGKKFTDFLNDASTAAAKFADAVGQAFRSSFNWVDAFAAKAEAGEMFLRDGAANAKDIAAASKAAGDADRGVIDARERLASIQGEMGKNQRDLNQAQKVFEWSTKRQPKYLEDFEQAQQRVKDNAKDQEDAQRGINDALEAQKTAHENVKKAQNQKGTGLLDYLKKATDDTRGFMENIKKLQTAGFPIEELNKLMVAGPEKAGELTRQLAEAATKNKDNLTGIFAEYSKSMKEMIAEATGQARIMGLIAEASKKSSVTGAQMGEHANLAMDVQNVVNRRVKAGENIDLAAVTTEVAAMKKTYEIGGKKVTASAELVATANEMFAIGLAVDAQSWGTSLGLTEQAIRDYSSTLKVGFDAAMAGINIGKAEIEAMIAAAKMAGTGGGTTAETRARRRVDENWKTGQTIGGASANGNIFRNMARVLSFAQGTENHVAQIGKKGQARLWNEPETQGEAYIPLALAKRGRSSRILSAVAQDFGYQLVKMAQGGVVRAPGAGSGFGGGGGSPTSQSTAHNYSFDGAIFQPQDFNKFVKETEAQARLKALSGGL